MTMHTNRISPARKIIAWVALATALLLFAGCETVTLTNLTPPSMPENPSQIYTFSLRVTPRTNTVAKTSIQPKIVINQQIHPMRLSSLGEGIYDFDFKPAPGQEAINYYFLVNYTVEGNSVQTAQEAYTDLTQVKIVRRYVLSLEVNRGPVGARISVLGRGFTTQDVIAFSGTPVRTQWDSPTSLSFFVPALTPGNYSITLTSPAGNSPVGTFRIDPSTVTVFPTALNLRVGESQQLTFTIPNPAPASGTLLDIQTDIPESVIMPEVIIREGSTAAIVSVQGGKAGSGNLFLKGYGTGELTIPVTVTAR